MKTPNKEEVAIIIDGHITEYSVDFLGNIYSNKFNKKKLLSQNDIKGYKMCYLYVNGKRYDILVHRIVANHFIENIDKKEQVNHINGLKDDNKYTNLEWATQSENIKHAYDNKLMIKTYKDCYNSLLNFTQVKDIRKRLLTTETQRSIAFHFNVSEQCISSIKHGKSYKGVGLIENNLAIPK